MRIVCLLTCCATLAACFDGRAPEAEVSSGDARTPDADLPDAGHVDARIDAPQADATLPDAASPEPDPDAASPEPDPDAALPDAALPDAAVPDPPPDVAEWLLTPWAAHPAHPFRERLDAFEPYQRARALPTPGFAVGTRGRGMMLFDLDAGTHAPVPSGSIGPLNVSADRTAAVATLGSGRSVLLYDLTDGPAPRRVGQFLAPDQVWRSAISPDGRAAYGANAHTVYGIDFSDRARPEARFTLEFEWVRALAASSALLLVAQIETLHVFDVRDPDAPVEWAQLVMDPPINRVALTADGRIAYGAFAGGVLALDLSDPAAPAPLSRVADNQPGGGQDMTLSADEQTLFVTRGGGVTVIDVRDPQAMVVRGVFEDGVDLRSADGLAGSTAFVLAGQTGLTRVDLRNPGQLPSAPHPALDALACPQDEAMRLTPDGAAAFVFGDATTLADLTGGGASPARYPSANGATLSSDGARLFLATDDGLLIYDARAPDAPVLLGTYPTDAAVMDVALSPDEQIAYLATWQHGGLEIVDVSAPAAPIELSRIFMRQATDVVLSPDGDTAFLFDPVAEFVIVDVTDPAAPRPHYQPFPALPPRAVQAVAVSPDSTTLAVATDGEVSVFSLERPLEATLRGRIDRLRITGDLRFSADGARVFVAEEAGLRVIDVTDATTLALYETPAVPIGVARTAADEIITLNSEGSRCLSRLAFADPPTLQPLRAAPGVARYRLTWSDRYPDAPEQIAWHATDGEVAVLQVDQDARTAVVEWTRVDDASAGALEIAIGNFHYYEVARAQAD